MIVLASSSPRRTELFKKITNDFIAVSPTCEEVYPDSMIADEVSTYLSIIKADNVYKKHLDDVVIGADTVIVFENNVIGKARNEFEAYRTLTLLSGKEHRVITGVTVLSKEFQTSFCVSATVKFWKLTETDISKYLKTGEYQGKAGAYAIQGYGGLLVERIEGDFNTIVGLPISTLARKLTNANLL